MKKILSELFPSIFKNALQPNDVVAAGEQLLSHWVTAVNHCDVDAVIQLFAADVIFYGTSTKTLITSSEGVRQYFEQAFTQLQPLAMSLDNKKMLPVSDDAIFSMLRQMVSDARWSTTSYVWTISFDCCNKPGRMENSELPSIGDAGINLELISDSAQPQI